MEGQYRKICRKYGLDAKVFTKESGSMKKKLGTPDLLVLFTSTVSHKMVFGVLQEAKRSGIPIARCHSSSMSALENILNQRYA
jgi:hypothetical protein